ncbi:MAG: hypothetical protein J7J20_07000 [Desulfurococcales archaeon]|nr:hypothetical protein [Desulfurococcales archaeon]
MEVVRVGYITDLNQREHIGEELLRELLMKHEVHIILIGGDCNLDPQKLPFKNRIRYYILSGDKDDIYVTKEARKNNILLDGSIIRLNRVFIAGIGGLDYYQNVARLDKILSTSNNLKIDILVIHHPPLGCLDLIEPLGLRAGLRTIRNLIVKLKPTIVLTGHLRNKGICYIEGSLVVNPGPADEGNYAVLELGHTRSLREVLLGKLSSLGYAKKNTKASELSSH